MVHNFTGDWKWRSRVIAVSLTSILDRGQFFSCEMHFVFLDRMMANIDWLAVDTVWSHEMPWWWMAVVGWLLICSRHVSGNYRRMRDSRAAAFVEGLNDCYSNNDNDSTRHEACMRKFLRVTLTPLVTSGCMWPSPLAAGLSYALYADRSVSIISLMC